MGLRFRKVLRLLPGLRLNFSKSGVSASVGRAPFTANTGKGGTMFTASAPGTGISYRSRRRGERLSTLRFTIYALLAAFAFWYFAR